ncbi:MAG TPA: class I SAM-dependent RNA methyltransferase [bacterium]|nr:class I SAM-dependent RNA methyltransferase [bacterium]
MAEKEILIESLAFGGEGVGRDDGKVVFVPGTVPGERVRVRVLSDHGKYERAELAGVIEPSPDRAAPPCEVFGSCGGCQWQHVAYEAQLRWKQRILFETLVRVGRVAEPNVLPILGAPHPWHYRSRIQLQVDAGGAIGFHAPKTHSVVTFGECKIADSRLNAKLEELKRASSIGAGELELSLNGTSEVHVRERSAGPAVFSQVNRAQNEKLVEVVMDFAFGKAEAAFTRKKKVVELYAGSGNLSFPLAERAGAVHCVEESAEAVNRAETLMNERGVANMHWIAGHAEWGLKKLYRRKIVPDLLVLDPPRRGAKEILDLVCVMKPRQVVYVSCDPVTLARDLNLLTRRHYRLEKVQPIDMFPQTYHIESVSLLSLRSESKV